MKSSHIKIIFYFFLVSFIANSCRYKKENLVSTTSQLYYTNYSNPIFTNDSIYADSLKLDINFIFERFDKKEECATNLLNPIGALMGLSIGIEYCFKNPDLLITSNYTYNGLAPGVSLNHLFKSSLSSLGGDKQIKIVEEGLTDVFERYTRNSTYTTMHLFITEKPDNPEQQFFIEFTTDIGIYQTETSKFYWL